MNFGVDDLLPMCEKCEGTGKLENPVLNENRGGYGRRVVGASPVSCDACSGKGAIPTESGKALLEFLKRAKSKGLLL